MIIFIINTIIILLSIFLLIFNYYYIKDSSKALESRMKRFIFGGMELLGIGIVLVGLSVFGSKIYDIDIKTLTVVFIILFSVIVYANIILLWNKLFILIKNDIPKKIKRDYRYKFKSITIYGLVYSFGILFYILYAFVLFK